jgi:hypothetical protein
MYTGFSRFDGRLFPVVVVKLAGKRLAERGLGVSELLPWAGRAGAVVGEFDAVLAEQRRRVLELGRVVGALACCPR